NYDTVVVDTFSSGHFLALLRAPFGFSEAVRFGPMGEQTRSIIDVLKSSSTHYHLVSLAEELPIQETLELSKDLRELLGVEPMVWMNRWIPDPEKHVGGSLPDHFRHSLRNIHLRQEQAQKLLSPRKRFPWVFSSDFIHVAKTLSEAVDV